MILHYVKGFSQLIFPSASFYLNVHDSWHRVYATNCRSPFGLIICQTNYRFCDYLISIVNSCVICCFPLYVPKSIIFMLWFEGQYVVRTREIEYMYCICITKRVVLYNSLIILFKKVHTQVIRNRRNFFNVWFISAYFLLQRRVHILIQLVQCTCIVCFSSPCTICIIENASRCKFEACSESKE